MGISEIDLGDLSQVDVGVHYFFAFKGANSLGLPVTRSSRNSAGIKIW
jgi:outer membrane receptor for ferric coprogen and ferric-rhodotorulic acid